MKMTGYIIYIKKVHYPSLEPSGAGGGLDQV